MLKLYVKYFYSTKKMVTWKFAALLLWKMIDIYQKETNNSINLVEEMEVTPANTKFTGSIRGWARTKAESFLIDLDSY